MEKSITEIIVATQNAGKVAEFKAALNGLPYKVLSLADLGKFPEAPEQGETFAENASSKAQFYARLTGELCLADDSGLEVDYLNGEPGVYSARYAGENAGDQDNNEKLLEQLVGVPTEKRTARFRCVLVLAEAEKLWYTADGVVEGIILTEPRGTSGFGYDPLLFIPEMNRTFAEMSPEEKNQISHRGRALKKLVAQLADQEK
ncbi:dITP/XTP pyrophosphatase [Sporomusa ovata DSM 2662]|uniref:dITP/XTP pyrophosphatase n=1 Tax=Sporomusa ovata TaxID=2378 RepID=A0A0U1KZ43_9FIRM|nr:non-canonical purine NTP pyrophosphatase, RdgB/HAM1 family [Sporomusa ovata DSM 2662]CQR71934.1 Nucleoside 5-triphosphatase RdgB (dHAPTP, dITP, XTP-specific) [Sporomusa ovata]